MIQKEKKQAIITEFARKEGDTGSCEVQVAILSARIAELTEHLKKNNNDEHSRRGLQKLVSQRKKLIKYYESTNLEAARALKAKLGIR